MRRTPLARGDSKLGARSKPRRVVHPFPLPEPGQVITLAENAYNERSKRICEMCDHGSKLVQIGDGDTERECVDCQPCECQGNPISVGQLDNFRLALLADALEEAGCDNDEVLFHLRGIVGCDRCEGAGYVYMTEALSSRTACPACSGEGLVPPGKHYRGCYVLDAILGLS